MTHDKVRQDFEAYMAKDFPKLMERSDDDAVRCARLLWTGYQARDAEIREKLESEGVKEGVAWEIEGATSRWPIDGETRETAAAKQSKAAITKILRVI